MYAQPTHPRMHTHKHTHTHTRTRTRAHKHKATPRTLVIEIGPSDPVHEMISRRKLKEGVLLKSLVVNQDRDHSGSAEWSLECFKVEGRLARLRVKCVCTT